MASDSNCKKLVNLFKDTRLCNFLPYEVNLNPSLKLVMRKTKTWLIVNSFSIVTNVIFNIYLLTVFVSNSNQMSMANLIVLFGTFGVFLTILFPHIWMFMNLQSFMCVVNTFFKLNHTLCKYCTDILPLNIHMLILLVILYTILVLNSSDLVFCSLLKRSNQTQSSAIFKRWL